MRTGDAALLGKIAGDRGLRKPAARRCAGGWRRGRRRGPGSGAFRRRRRGRALEGLGGVALLRPLARGFFDEAGKLAVLVFEEAEDAQRLHAG